jgi:hypothetical protein
MPNYRNKETGEVKRFASVRITWNEDGSSNEMCLVTGESLLENWDFIPHDGEWNVKMKKATTDGGGMR